MQKHQLSEYPVDLQRPTPNAEAWFKRALSLQALSTKHAMKGTLTGLTITEELDRIRICSNVQKYYSKTTFHVLPGDQEQTFDQVKVRLQ